MRAFDNILFPLNPHNKPKKHETADTPNQQINIRKHVLPSHSGIHRLARTQHKPHIHQPINDPHKINEPSQPYFKLVDLMTTWLSQNSMHRNSKGKRCAVGMKNTLAPCILSVTCANNTVQKNTVMNSSETKAIERKWPFVLETMLFLVRIDATRKYIVVMINPHWVKKTFIRVGLFEPTEETCSYFWRIVCCCNE